MKSEVATLAGGCFWCTEAIFKRLKGVKRVESGYAGKSSSTFRNGPTYEEVSRGTTNHAEAIQITFDPHIIKFEHLLEIFFHTHNPTTINHQGADIGTQYRSVIFYHDKDQKKTAEQVKDSIEEAKVYKEQIVTSIEPFSNFFKAENYHQDYYEKNKDDSYCRIVIDPKIRRLMQLYKKDVKSKFVS